MHSHGNIHGNKKSLKKLCKNYKGFTLTINTLKTNSFVWISRSALIQFASTYLDTCPRRLAIFI